MTRYDVTLRPTVVDGVPGYSVEFCGMNLGVVYRPRASEKSGWAFRNDERGWYGTVRARGQATDALVELWGRS